MIANDKILEKTLFYGFNSKSLENEEVSNNAI